MVYQRVRPYINVLGMFTRGFVIGVPVVITFVDYVGSVKGVTGISMQVSFKSSFRDIKFPYFLTHISQNLSSENLKNYPLVTHEGVLGLRFGVQSFLQYAI